MKDKILTDEAKRILVGEYGKDAIKIDKELNELASLSIKSKHCIQAVNKGNSKTRESYIQIDNEIKKMVIKINEILANWC